LKDLAQMLDTDILSLGMAADEARRSSLGSGRVTYLRVHVTTAAEIATGAPVPGAAAEVRLYEMPASLDEALALVRSVDALAGRRRVTAFSMADVEAHAAGGWGTVEDVLRALVAAGLDDVAELPADRLADLHASAMALKTAGADPQRVTVSHAIGDRKLDVIETVRKVFGAVSTLRRFAPLPRVAPIDKPTTGYDDIRMVALARLALAATSIEVDWSLYGPKLAQVALTFGADHLDGVAATTDTTLGPRRSTIEDVERNIKAAGFEPQEYSPVS
jgi:2-iminoacetate synthase ThiH